MTFAAVHDSGATEAGAPSSLIFSGRDPAPVRWRESQSRIDSAFSRRPRRAKAEAHERGRRSPAGAVADPPVPGLDATSRLFEPVPDSGEDVGLERIDPLRRIRHESGSGQVGDGRIAPARARVALHPVGAEGPGEGVTIVVDGTPDRIRSPAEAAPQLPIRLRQHSKGVHPDQGRPGQTESDL